MIGPRQINVVVVGGLVIDRGLKVFVAKFSDRYVIDVESQLAWPCFNAYYSILFRLRLPEGPREGKGSSVSGNPVHILRPNVGFPGLRV